MCAIMGRKVFLGGQKKAKNLQSPLRNKPKLVNAGSSERWFNVQ